MAHLTEDWQIEYDMQTQSGKIVAVSERFPCRLGYHQRLSEWYIERGFEGDIKPISNIHGDYVQLLSLGVEEGRHLPLDKTVELAGAELLASQEHPITLTAPDRTRYVHMGL